MSFKAIILLAKRDDMTHDEFITWWTHEHAPLARGLEGLRRIVFNDITNSDDVDGITELWFDTEEDFHAAYATEHGKSVAADSIAHVRSRTRVFAIETPIFP